MPNLSPAIPSPPGSADAFSAEALLDQLPTGLLVVGAGQWVAAYTSLPRRARAPGAWCASPCGPLPD